MEEAFRIDYDDRPADVVEKVNVLIRRRGLELVSNGLEHDGFEIYELKVLPSFLTRLGKEHGIRDPDDAHDSEKDLRSSLEHARLIREM